MEENNKKQEKFSYSKLDLFDKCPYRFKLKYEDKNFSSSTSIALETGTLAHKIKELVALDLIAGKKPDYASIEDVFIHGYKPSDSEKTAKDKTEEGYILGIEELKKKYWETWCDADNKSGMNYDQKTKLFLEHLKDTENDPYWHPIAVEMPFDFLFDDKYLMHGFIDKLDEDKNGNIRVVDYKTSKAAYDDKELKTPLQMVAYDYGVMNEYDKLPTTHMYDFIFINETRLACSKGYFTRGQNKLRKIFDNLEQCRATGEFQPKPTPLCHWCDFCATNPDADPKLKGLCPYHALWTPNNRTFEVKNKYVYGQPIKKQEDIWF